MKGTFFQKPQEFNLFIEGESWRQGDPVSGTLTVKNHGADPVDAADLRVVLAHGAIAKVRKKDAGAFTIVSTAAMSGQKITQGGQVTFPWKFETDRNCTVTDKGASLFLLYGKGEALDQLGQIQLVFHPYFVIEEFLKTLQTQFRFVLKTQKTNKGWVECKIDPPASRSYAAMELLTLSFRFEGETLHVEYLFDVKKVEATAASMDLKKQKREFEQSFPPSQYLRSGRFNHEAIETAIRDVLSQLGLTALW